MRTDKPWGFEETIYVGSRYVFKKLFMKKGESCSLQYHRQKHETVLVFSGQLSIEVGLEVHAIEMRAFGPGDSIVLEPGVIHRMTAIEDCVYFEASTPELDDVVRLEDRYGRAESKN
jgi:mannose-6-phosphate isomerase-like protein (cupin superfamily)